MIIGCGIGIWPAALAGGAAAFNPISLFGGGEQGVVYDLTNTATMFQERTGAAATTPSGANGPIGTLKDLSPNNNYAIAPSDAARPLSRQGAGAPNVYGEWDGIGDVLNASFSVSQPWTRVASYRILSDVASGRVFGNPGGFLLRAGAGIYRINAGSTIGNMLVSVPETLVSTELFNGASSAIAKNNEAYTTGDAGTTTPTELSMGALNDGSLSVPIYFFRLVQIGRLLTDPEIAQCRTWCGAAAGLVL